MTCKLTCDVHDRYDYHRSSETSVDDFAVCHYCSKAISKASSNRSLTYTPTHTCTYMRTPTHKHTQVCQKPLARRSRALREIYSKRAIQGIYYSRRAIQGSRDAARAALQSSEGDLLLFACNTGISIFTLGAQYRHFRGRRRDSERFRLAGSSD